MFSGSNGLKTIGCAGWLELGVIALSSSVGDSSSASCVLIRLILTPANQDAFAWLVDPVNSKTGRGIAGVLINHVC